MCIKAKKTKQLGMNPSTASGRLKIRLLFISKEDNIVLGEVPSLDKRVSDSVSSAVKFSLRESTSAKPLFKFFGVNFAILIYYHCALLGLVDLYDPAKASSKIGGVKYI